ncbi:MAG: hypothetical protein EP330_04355 [Deltaproteobacteria bacterium]|nr:MAG: hypothetical protein EP330_04355 [Deltaproteobacteria bacterium]
MAPISMRYNLAFPALLFVAGLFMLGVGLLVGELTQLVLGCMNVLLGFLFATQPMWVLTGTEIQVRNALGMTLKRHGYSSLAELEVRGGSLHRKSDGSKLVGKSFVGRQADWDAVVAAVSGA